MTTATREAMYERIEKHGRDLLAIFPNATERDPVNLCKKLRRLERVASDHAVRRCNGEFEYEDDAAAVGEAILRKVNAILGNSRVPVFLNGDPRGYALKISDQYVRQFNVQIHRDWGGYGIIAPDLSEG